MKKRWQSIVSMALACLMLLGLFCACTTKDPDQKTNVAPGEVGYVSLDINPEISLTVDANGVVTGVFGENEDGQVLLYNESGIVGVPIEDAVNKITTLAIELGFLSEENSVIAAEVSCAGEEAEKKLLDAVTRTAKAAARDAELALTVSTESPFSVLRELEALKEAHPEITELKTMTASQYKLVASACESGAATIEEAVKMSEAELIAALSTSYQKVEQFATDAYEAAKAEAFVIYDKAAGLLLDGVYTEFYVQNAPKHPTTVYYGGTYQMYASTARGLDAVADLLAFVENVRNYELSDAQVSAVLAAMKLSDADRVLIANTEGKVTVKSVEAYADKLLKNAKLSAEEIAQIKTDLDAALDAAEAALAETVSAEAQRFEGQVRDILKSADSLIESCTSLLVFLPESLRTEALKCFDAYKTVKAEVERVLEGKDLSEKELRALAEDLRLAAEGIKEKIDADLSDDEKKAVAERLSVLEATIAGYKATFESQLAVAEKAARSYLQALKDKYRKQAAA